MSDVAANVVEVERRIAAACARAGRSRGEVTLIAVTKTFPADAVSAALAAGISDVGENRVQEARDKKPSVASPARWHLIGHLQSNKAKDAVKLFDVIQTVDSFALAEKIARAAEGAGKRQEVLLQINVGREAQKSGVDPEDSARVLAEVQKLEALDVRGVMAIPPAADDPEESRRWFRDLRTLRDALGVRELSMGMSADYEVAIEEGATMVRVGSAIFGSRH